MGRSETNFHNTECFTINLRSIVCVIFDITLSYSYDALGRLNHAVVGHGVRIRLAERPDDEALEDLNYIRKHQEIVGSQWFFPFERVENGIGYMPKNFSRSRIAKPEFDRSEITKK